MHFPSTHAQTTDILPHNTSAGPETREFLQQVVDVLLDFVKATNDRNEKVLEFHHPEDMKRLLDLDVPENGLPLQQLVQDCATTLKYQVKTGESVVDERPSTRCIVIWDRAVHINVKYDHRKTPSIL